MRLALDILLGAAAIGIVGFALINVALGLLAAWSLRDDIWLRFCEWFRNTK